MGTYSTWEFYETFGGWPEPGETYPDDPDAARDEAEQQAIEEAVARDDAPEPRPPCGGRRCHDPQGCHSPECWV